MARLQRVQLCFRSCSLLVTPHTKAASAVRPGFDRVLRLRITLMYVRISYCVIRTYVSANIISLRRRRSIIL